MTADGVIVIDKPYRVIASNMRMGMYIKQYLEDDICVLMRGSYHIHWGDAYSCNKKWNQIMEEEGGLPYV